MSASPRVGLSSTDLSTITSTLHALQQQMQQMASSMQLLSSTFAAIAQCSSEEEKAVAYEPSESRANPQHAAADEYEEEEEEDAAAADTDERRRDNSRVMRALEEEEKRYERPAPLTMAGSGALTYTAALSPQKTAGNVWKKATLTHSTSSSSASAVLGVASMSPTRSASRVTSSPATPPLPSSITTLPPLSSITSSGSFAQRGTVSRSTLLSEARRQSIENIEESSASMPVTLTSPFSAQQQQPTKRATSPLPASHNHPATSSVFNSTSIAEGRSSRSSSDTQPAAPSAAAIIASPRSARPATAHSPPTHLPVPRPLPTSLDDLDDIPTAHIRHPSTTHPFPSSTPTSPLHNKHIFLSHPNKVKLNVGGTLFHTTVTTLTSPTAHSSMLHAMFAHSSGGSHFPLELDDKGAVFLDRDPQLFRYILNYLRDGSLPLSSLSAATKLGLLREARYFGLSGLMREVQAEVREMKKRERRELSQEKEYKCVVGVEEKELTTLMHRMCMMEGYDFENWIVAGGGGGGGGSGEARGGRGGSLGGLSMGGLGGGGGKEVGGRLHVLFSKKLSRGELMLLDRLQTGM